MATHSSTLAWKIPWTKKTGRLQSMGCPSILVCLFNCLSIIHIIRTEARSPVSSGWVKGTKGSMVPIKMILLITKFRLKLKKVFLIAQLVKNLPAMQETPV